MEVTVYKADNHPHERDSIIPIGRLDVKMTAAILGFQPHDIRALVAAKLLEPLGNPEPNASKYFAWVDIQEKARNKNWLGKATDAIYDKWNVKNASRKANKEENREDLPEAA